MMSTKGKTRVSAFDYKKEYKEFYMPKNKPSIVTVPRMDFIAVRGTGDPTSNQETIGIGRKS